MKTYRFWWLGGTGLAFVLAGVLFSLPVWAAPSKQADEPKPDAYAAMHAACVAGDTQAMGDAMGSITEEDWQAMQGHMSDGHHANMGAHMGGQGQGSMMGQTGTGMMGGSGRSGMMGGRSGMMGGW
ncbi:MAG: hypothetical protein HY683_10550 [Chloroflexi bacterium]|nr:hypothetical protein [Chloroflexota bacterium]